MTLQMSLKMKDGEKGMKDKERNEESTLLHAL
jgi:hypothetical protein